jgi:2-polyprenyl-6-methoxyphenol hydroxylase-like FAD-dependent oxidoreductase
MTETGVLLRLGDGTSIGGSIVVGADGVHSQVRDISK